MNDLLAGLLWGLSSALMTLLGSRFPAFGWVALSPLAVLTLHGSLAQVALAAGCTGAFASAAVVWTKTLRSLFGLTATLGSVGWALSFTAASWVVRGRPALLLLALPAATVLATLPLRALGAPRWVSNPLARTQERWLVIVHTARCGGDLATSALLASASAASALLISPGVPRHTPLAALGLIALVILFAAHALRSAIRRCASGRSLRVAAVVCDGPVSSADDDLGPTHADVCRDVEGSVARYAPLVRRAATQGARLIVMPEVAVHLDAITRPRWLEEAQCWARDHDLTVVCPYFNLDLPQNELVVVDARGVVASYEKQHPARKLEPARCRKLPVGPHFVEAGGTSFSLSTAICVDLDYGDTARSARRARALLAAPSKDWFDGFERLHDRTAVWSAVIANVPLVRATGHGISSIYDAAGRILAQASSRDGPVVLVADVSLPA